MPSGRSLIGFTYVNIMFIVQLFAMVLLSNIAIYIINRIVNIRMNANMGPANYVHSFFNALGTFLYFITSFLTLSEPA